MYMIFLLSIIYHAAKLAPGSYISCAFSLSAVRVVVFFYAQMAAARLATEKKTRFNSCVSLCHTL